MNRPALRAALSGGKGRSALFAAACLAGAGAAALAGAHAVADPLLLAAAAPAFLLLLRDIARGLARGDTALDMIAALAIGGALVLGEWLAGAVVGLMYAGGQVLEAYADHRARSEMGALLARAPRTALRHVDSTTETVPVEAIRAGDRLLIRRGEVLPVDGVAAVPVSLDESALTGEALPATRHPGEVLRSGAVNAGEAFDLSALRGAEQSTYAGILRLVAAAMAERAPMARLAGRAALGFLAATLLLAGAAWALSGDPVRALAVLVVATPCPLILAVPVALTAGVSRAARAGLLVKGAGALERLAAARVALLDKTGTLTAGRPRLSGVRPEPGISADEALRLAASLEQASAHVFADPVIAAARARGLALSLPEETAERPGEGLSGRIGGRLVRLGGDGFVAGPQARSVGAEVPAAGPPRPAGTGGTACSVIHTAAPPGLAEVALSVDGARAATLLIEDPLRPDAPALVASLRALGFRHVALLTGDRPEAAARVAAELGLDAVQAARDPAGKAEAVRAARALGPVLMLGDGVNDAPALAAAEAGERLGGQAMSAGAEAADAVLLGERLAALSAGLRVARRAVAIARQSAYAGIGLSSAAMVAAALGWLSPVEGALLQEAIDVAVVLNALRALRG
ncbi:MAG: heavy metal translocating P-type ATPase [Acetobacteraceae bacterium]|nr:heavy metal translocating P-type ATPase [Acetobacteraceae bacterium]